MFKNVLLLINLTVEKFKLITLDQILKNKLLIIKNQSINLFNNKKIIKLNLMH